MSTEPERPEDELRLIACALRERLLWQDACGAHGLPHAPPSEKKPEPVLAPPPMRPLVNPPPRAELEAPSRPPTEVVPVRAVYRPDRPVDQALSPQARTERLATVAQAASTCELCPLHRGRKNVVYGVGPVDADFMIVGEGPGAEEDVQGIPFVGKAGQLLDRMLAAMGYDRTQIYIGNVVKCRPPDNRTPDEDEMAACMPYLREQIELVRPKVLLAMGTTAVRGLLGVGGITRIRGRWKLYQGSIPVMPTFHPAYLLRNEAAKRDVWNDLKEVLRHLNREVPKRGQ